MLSEATRLFRIFKADGRVPSQWNQRRQVHIPRLDADAAGGVIVVEAPRPIAVTSAWYRLLASSRYRSCACTRWFDDWRDDDMLGCRKKVETAEGVAWASGQVALGGHLCTRDYALAFDHTHPEAAAAAMEHLGLPGNVNGMLEEVWQQRVRLLQLGVAVHPDP